MYFLEEILELLVVQTTDQRDKKFVLQKILLNVAISYLFTEIQTKQIYFFRLGYAPISMCGK